MAENSTIAHVTDASFAAEVIKHNQLVVVDFWAAWCAPCRALAPVLEEIAQQFQGKMKIVSLNVDEQPQTASEYGVRALPTLLAFKDGQVVEQIVGAVAKAKLEAMINSHL